MQDYRAAVAAGRPYIPGERAGVFAGLFGGTAQATATSDIPRRDRADADLAPPVAKDNALPEMLPEREDDPPNERMTEGISIFERLPPETVLSDAQPDELRAGDQLANKKLMTNIQEGVVFRAYYKNDKGAHSGRQEHARHGPGGDYHFHLYDMNGKAGPRISSETFLPLENEDRDLFTGKFKAAIENLGPEEKRYLYKANREVFHTGNLPLKLLMKLGMEKAMSKGTLLPPVPRSAE